MKTTKHYSRIFPSLLLLACLIASCKQVTQAISNLLTFDINKTANIPVSQYTPTGILTPFVGIPIGIDSADLAKQKTSLSLVKTLKLTILTFTPDDPAYPMTNFDTLTLAVGPDSLNTVWLASYSGSADKVILTKNDFAANARDSKNKFFVRFKLKNDPTHTVNIKTDYILTFTADPF